MADKLKRELGVDAELTVGDRGEWTVWVDGRQVAKKGMIAFPSDKRVVGAVRAALPGGGATETPVGAAGGRKR